MNGLGNDFVVLDARADALALVPDAIRAIADRKEGIGCDQLVALEPSTKADVFMRIWNADGGEVAACGNAARCVAALVAAEQGRPQVSIETEDQVLGALVGSDNQVTIDMGVPRLAWNEIPLAEPFHDTRRIELQAGPIDAPVMHSPAVVNVGNPHALFFVDDVEAIDLGRIGSMLEHHPLFPERANISLVQVLSPGHLKIRTWERGAGLTRACGTAACASAVAAIRRELTGRKVKVSLPGGDLVIEWREADGHVLMTGPYALDFEGTLPEGLLAGAGV
ncbi:diaminopimelate epimerase [Methyloceanibacter superfactus]|uniref:Diaminopimelate epimerase n=1 Tax=Methyloceanibacter superfactus TaxID=1774969 RepID=A0A1E3VR58_9HYPH|nr:diaminopimelate epimerase [Methyloceanibacter superfactus]ODR96027.1 diaminopimelate epimerase [Methyloceanibacter superfactus]